MPRTVIILILLISSCAPKVDIEQCKKEIVETERQFAQMAKEAGIAEAFYHFADDSARIIRNPAPVIGKEGIRDYYDTPFWDQASLSWKPDFVDVSASGDMGFTYGKFKNSSVDSTGQTVEWSGTFRTIWKKQKNGSWRYVLD